MVSENKPKKTKRITATQARAARRSRSALKKNWWKSIGFGLIILVAIAFIVSLFLPGLPFAQNSSSTSTNNNDGGPGQFYSSQGRDHIDHNEPHPAYSSYPATSGWHYSTAMGTTFNYDEDLLAPALWGIYEEELPDEVLVHNLEHGGIRIHYNCPESCTELINQLKDMTKLGRKIIISPYSSMESKIALVAWNYLDEFDEFDEMRIREFIAVHESSANAPEWQVP
jgi:hypothetical protein